MFAVVYNIITVIALLRGRKMDTIWKSKKENEENNEFFETIKKIIKG